jgi:poly(A) polymerase
MPGITPETLTRRIRNQKTLIGVLGARFRGKVYLVGGAVREILLGKTPRDFDFALEKEEDLQVFEGIFGSRSFILGKKPIQTHRIIKDRTTIDITLLQGSLAEDLARRDFTMNAMAYDVSSGEFVDTLGGAEDLRAKMIRCPGRETLMADPLRMLKAVRHFATLKGFLCHEDLLEATRELKSQIHKTAPERIKYEVDLIMCSAGVFGGIKLLEYSGLLFEIFPELSALKEMDGEKGFELETFGHTIDGFRYLKKYRGICGLDDKATTTVGYALLFHDLGKAETYSYDETKGVVHFFHHERVSGERALPIMERLKFSSHEIKAICLLIEHHMRIFLITSDESTEKATRRVVYKVGELTPSLILLTLCDL